MIVALGAAVVPVSVAAAADSATASAPKVSDNGTIRVTVTATGAGSALVRGVRVGTSPVGVLCSVTATFPAAGTTGMACVPTATAQKLRRNGAIRLRVTLVFTAADGSTSTTPLGVVVLPKLQAPKPSGASVPVTG